MLNQVGLSTDMNTALDATCVEQSTWRDHLDGGNVGRIVQFGYHFNNNFIFHPRSTVW